MTVSSAGILPYYIYDNHDGKGPQTYILLGEEYDSRTKSTQKWVWDAFGGAINSNESAAQCAARECTEELVNIVSQKKIQSLLDNLHAVKGANGVRKVYDQTHKNVTYYVNIQDIIPTTTWNVLGKDKFGNVHPETIRKMFLSARYINYNQGPMTTGIGANGGLGLKDANLRRDQKEKTDVKFININKIVHSIGERIFNRPTGGDIVLANGTKVRLRGKLMRNISPVIFSHNNNQNHTSPFPLKLHQGAYQHQGSSKIR